MVLRDSSLIRRLGALLAAGYLPSKSGEKTDMGEKRAVKYRSRSGDVLDADVVFESGTTAAIEVKLPGTKFPLRLSRIPLLAADEGRNATCFPASA